MAGLTEYRIRTPLTILIRRELRSSRSHWRNFRASLILIPIITFRQWICRFSAEVKIQIVPPTCRAS